ncbi:flagellar biosynthetic protein FliO [Aliiglaciecola sp. CAU 1673]|uniref:flagellar biosynthetic protein FliO n=1 Tax=Aliiglaciecola sp. CAU 1673 TaxID=3032595 RepID=UPI0023DCA389|nr:flagellar biosynthetic protein FliO [Aliiglaciecola sp. CAU 1673]MDF2178284.1 flagellar biosynthetic protein FliO [Aliiglaciecola sp. CAU 1673]
MLSAKSNVLKSSGKTKAKLFFSSLASLSSPVFADNVPLSSPGDFLSILLSLVIVVALVFMLGYLMRRFNVTHAGSGQLKIMGSMALGTRERVLVIEVGNEQHLLGVTSQQITHLAKLQEPISPAVAPGESFKNKLSQYMQGKGQHHD